MSQYVSPKKKKERNTMFFLVVANQKEKGIDLISLSGPCPAVFLHCTQFFIFAFTVFLNA